MAQVVGATLGATLEEFGAPGLAEPSASAGDFPLLSGSPAPEADHEGTASKSAGAKCGRKLQAPLSL